MSGAVCASMAWATIWPFDVVKSRVQSGNFEGRNVTQVLREVVKDGALFRGLVPGLVRSAVANGCGMVAYNHSLKLMKNM